MDVEGFFQGYPDSRALFAAVSEPVEALGPPETRVTKTQISFRRKRIFAMVWIPAKHLGRRMAPLVLSLVFPTRDPSPRWKEVVEPYPGRYIHHLELYQPGEVDEEVRRWLRAAWEAAG